MHEIGSKWGLYRIVVAKFLLTPSKQSLPRLWKINPKLCKSASFGHRFYEIELGVYVGFKIGFGVRPVTSW